MGKWHKVEKSNRKSPCDGCEAGSASYSYWEDPVTKEGWVKTDGCTETCERFREGTEEYAKTNKQRMQMLEIDARRRVEIPSPTTQRG